MSLASVAVEQVFTKVGTYRGTIVRTKELVFSKRREICRKTMKEMRLMREIRHDNINPFIGAVVEPNGVGITIVTEYGHKGSLPVRYVLYLFSLSFAYYLDAAADISLYSSAKIPSPLCHHLLSRTFWRTTTSNWKLSLLPRW